MRSFHGSPNFISNYSCFHICYETFFFYISFQVVVPSKELILAGKDAAAEYDDLAESQDFQDDPE